MLVRSAALDIVVIDSVAALVPRAEIEGEMGDTHVGLQARLMSQAMRKLSGSLSKFDTTALFINQLREKIGVMFGSPETTPGGRALKFYASVRLDVRKIENLKDGTEVVGSRTRVKVVKNKVAPPVPPVRVRHHVRQGHLEGGLADRRGRRPRDRQEVRRLVHLRGRAAGTGPRERAGLPRRAHRAARRDRAQDPGGRRPHDLRRRRRRDPRSRSCPTWSWPTKTRARRRSPRRPTPSPWSRSPCHERALGLLAVRQRSRRELRDAPPCRPDSSRRRSTTCSSGWSASAWSTTRPSLARWPTTSSGSRRAGRRAVTGALLAKGVAPDSGGGRRRGGRGRRGEPRPSARFAKAARMGGVEPGEGLRAAHRRS